MKLFNTKYAVIFSSLILLSCNITKKVPQDAYMFRYHEFKVVHDKGEIINPIDKSELELVARIRPSRKWLYTRIPLRVYNMINQDKLKSDIDRINKRKSLRNREKLEKQKRKNEKRILKAQQRGDSMYKPYRIKLLDTIKPKASIVYPGFSIRFLLNNFGQKPVILDPNLVHRSTDQIRLYLEKKGYYHAEVTDSIIFNPKVGFRRRKRQASVIYNINLGKPHTIDSIYYEGESKSIHLIISKYLARNEILKKGDVFDRELLDGLRTDLARQLRNEAYYEFSPNHIIFHADTSSRTNGVRLGITILPRTIRSKTNRDSIIVVPQRLYKVGEVFFHFSDTLDYGGKYRDDLAKRGLMLSPGSFFPTLDTFKYQPTGIIHAERRTATFLYNGKMQLKPEILEMKNYLENGHWYRSYYLDRSYNQMLELDLFQSIQPVLVDKPDSAKVDVHYYLVPSKVQGFTFEPRATNSNGFLGVAASINYKHRNVFRQAGKFTASVSGGIETQPPLTESDDPNKKEQTFEFGPTMKLVVPGLAPVSYLKFSKRQTTTTEFSGGFNYQRRREFDRQLVQFNYLWKWRSDKMQTFQMGLPLISGFKLVKINIRSDVFRQRLEELNDLFLLNAYSNQLVFNDFKLVYNYTNESNLSKTGTPKSLQINYDMNLDLVGNTMALFNLNNSEVNDLGQKLTFGIPFSQFLRIDNDLRLYQKFSKSRILAMRLQAGFGYVYGNSKTAMPFDYAFFAGGSNDNRGWRARELSPGEYKFYADSNRTITQIGDIRLGASVEYRFRIPFTKRWHGAVFSDAGNIWTRNTDDNREGSKFYLNSFYKQIALSGGAGLRFDLSFLTVRFDVGVPIHNPAISPGGRWIWNSRDVYEQDLTDAQLTQSQRDNLRRPFMPVAHLAIGFPF